jgi:hypothetical protein
MEVSSQLNDLAALPKGKSSQYPFNRGLVRAIYGLYAFDKITKP